MTGTTLDLLLVLAAVGFALSGYRQGFVVGVLSFTGFFGGAFLGTQLAPLFLARTTNGAAQPVVAILVVFLLAAVGQVLAVFVGHLIRLRLRSRSAQVLDSLAGALVSATAVLLVAWMVATPLASAQFPQLARAIRESVVIRTVDAVVPDQVRQVYGNFRHLLERGDFPEVFGSLSPTHVAPAAPPDATVVDTPAVRQARGSIVKIVGTAPDCARRIEGSGFVYAPQHVMTNAHVVAGVRFAQVQLPGRSLDAKVVLFDPERDVAVLYVPQLDQPALTFAGPAPAGTSAVVAGYPLDGPFTALPARIREVEQVRGPDIYQQHTVRRQVYALRGTVRNGNSGGPLLSPAGRVLGVVFAAAADDPQTGFALTSAEVSGDARAGAGATSAVSTQSCD